MFLDKKELPTLSIQHTVLTPSDKSIASEGLAIRAISVIPDDLPPQDKANINSLVNLLFILRLKFEMRLSTDYYILRNEEVRLNIYFPKHSQQQSEGLIAAIEYFKEQGCSVFRGGLRESLDIIVPIEKVEKAFQDLKSRSCSVTEELRKSFSVPW